MTRYKMDARSGTAERPPCSFHTDLPHGGPDSSRRAGWFHVAHGEMARPPGVVNADNLTCVTKGAYMIRALNSLGRRATFAKVLLFGVFLLGLCSAAMAEDYVVVANKSVGAGSLSNGVVLAIFFGDK